MALSQRKKKILQAVVESYIETASPVSSKEIQQKCLNDCSSATIRNELSALESMGFLEQPHVSAGRIPSVKAFRLYVDELMQTDPLSTEEMELINSYFDHKINSVEDMVQNVAKVISSITNYTSVVIKGGVKNEIIQTVKLLQVNPTMALVVIVTDNDIYKDNFIDLPTGIDSKWVGSAESWLNRLFSGKSFEQISAEHDLNSAIGEEFGMYRQIYEKIFEILIKVNNGATREVITEGAGKMFEHPEYENIDNARSFVSAIEHKEQLAELINSGEGDTVIKISEEDSDVPQGCSVVSANIKIGDKTVGSAGVIGPVRMNYKKVLSVLEHINSILDNIIDNKEEE